MKKIRPQSGPQEMSLMTPADICIYGGGAGGGKTWSLLMEPLRHVRNPQFSAVIFRRTSPQITNSGGLWDEASEIYPYTGGEPRIGSLEFRWPSGARVSFRHLQHEKNIYDWQGAQVPLIGFDELTHFTQEQFWYLLSRNRSTCGVRPYVRATCNPDADSWVAELIVWWIDQDSGFAIPDRSGKIRWFVRVNDQLIWSDSKEDLRQRYPGIPPKSLCFIPAKLSDNAELMKKDPGYLANLLALPLVQRERLLGGNWKIRPAAGQIFNSGWFEIVEASPAEATRVRYWDKAGTKDGGDYSCGVLMSRSESGIFFVEDVVRGQWSSLERNRIMRQTATKDGTSVAIWVEQEPGSGGKESAENTIREMAGFNVRSEPVTGDKITRANPYSAQCEAGNVKIVRASWNAAYVGELHAFPTGKHDDQVDASSGAFNKLALSVFDWGFVEENSGEKGLMFQLPEDI